MQNIDLFIGNRERERVWERKRHEFILLVFTLPCPEYFYAMNLVSKPVQYIKYMFLEFIKKCLCQSKCKRKSWNNLEVKFL